MGDYCASLGERLAEVDQQIRSSGWEGEAADAATDRSSRDRAKVGNVAEDLREGARIARQGASDEYAAISRLRYAVGNAQDAGFDVYEDYSVTSRETGGTAAQQVAQQAQAEEFASDIRSRAAQLVGLDQQVSAKITAAVGHIGKLTFDEHNGPTATDDLLDKPHSGVQLVDNEVPGPSNPDKHRTRQIHSSTTRGSVIGKTCCRRPTPEPNLRPFSRSIGHIPMARPKKLAPLPACIRQGRLGSPIATRPWCRIRKNTGSGWPGRRPLQ